MARHFENTSESEWRRGCRALGSLLIASGLVFTGLIGLGAMKAREMPAYAPQFVGWSLDRGTGCGGGETTCGLPIANQIRRKPIAPDGIRPLDLAPKSPDGGNVLRANIPEIEAPMAVLDFGKWEEYAAEDPAHDAFE